MDLETFIPLTRSHGPIIKSKGNIGSKKKVAQDDNLDDLILDAVNLS